MDQDLKNLIDETVNKVFPNGIPISGEEKYSKQEPGGTMMAVNCDEIQNSSHDLEEASYRIYNNTLCPELWDQYKHLNPRVRVNLLRMAYDFYEKTQFKAPIIDIYLMGSSANYNWTPDSDADVHVLIDFNQLQMPLETAKESIKLASSQWNIEHEVTVKGHKVEINIQSLSDKKPHVTGIYSLIKDHWVRQPSKQSILVNKPLVQSKYEGMRKYIESVIQSRSRDKMKEAKKCLDAFRQYGLDTVGELSTENIVYKILRSRGIIKGLKDAIVSTYDQEMTVKEKIREAGEHKIPLSSFTGGYCAEFALALHNKTGYRIVSFDEHIDHGEGDIEVQSIHYACKNGNLYYDAAGKRSESQIRSACLGSDMNQANNVVIRELTPKELKTETEIVPEALRQAMYILGKFKKEKINESYIKIPVIVGVITNDGEIKSERSIEHHEKLNFKGKLWRYNPKTEKVYWWFNNVTELDKDMVDDYLDKALIQPGEIGSVVVAKVGIDNIPIGTKGIITRKTDAKKEIEKFPNHWAAKEGVDYFYSIKWKPGGEMYQVLDKWIEPYIRK